MTSVIITTLGLAALLATLPLVLADVAWARPAAPTAPPTVDTFTTLMHGLPPDPLPSAAHRRDQPPNILATHSTNSGWHCVCNGTHVEGCWCLVDTAVPVIPGRAS